MPGEETVRWYYAEFVEFLERVGRVREAGLFGAWRALDASTQSILLTPCLFWKINQMTWRATCLFTQLRITAGVRQRPSRVCTSYAELLTAVSATRMCLRP